MDADEMAEYRQPLNTHDTAETFAVGVDDDDDEDMGESEVEMGFGDSEVEAGEDDLDPDAPPAAPFNPIAMGLKEIGGLARFRVSSYKPGNGVQELVNDDIDRYWQYVFSHPLPYSQLARRFFFSFFFFFLANSEPGLTVSNPTASP